MGRADFSLREMTFHVGCRWKSRIPSRVPGGKTKLASPQSPTPGTRCESSQRALTILLVHAPSTFRMHGSPRSHLLRVERMDMRPHAFGGDRNVTRSMKPHHPAGIERIARIGRNRLQRCPIQWQSLGTRRLHSPAHLEPACILTEVTLSVGRHRCDRQQMRVGSDVFSNRSSYSYSFSKLSTVQPP
jgi:hypothetical protein